MLETKSRRLFLRTASGYSQLRHVPASCSCSRARLRLRIVNSATVATATVKQDYHDANFPTDAEGRTYHLGTKKGQVANRILSVGSSQRAQLLAQYLKPCEKDEPLFQFTSSRGFITITGKYEGVPLSIVSTQMGMPNMDFVVRENRAVVDGPMAIIRVGTAGALQPPARLGQLMIASSGSICIRHDPDAYYKPENSLPYLFSRPALPCAELTGLLVEESIKKMGSTRIVEGLNATADSFYSSQGRRGTHFYDRNDALVKHLISNFPEVISLEMETFQLFDLARNSKGSISAAATTIALAERYTNSFLPSKVLKEIEAEAGLAALTALVRMPLDVPNTNGSVRSHAKHFPGISFGGHILPGNGSNGGTTHSNGHGNGAAHSNGVGHSSGSIGNGKSGNAGNDHARDTSGHATSNGTGNGTSAINSGVHNDDGVDSLQVHTTVEHATRAAEHHGNGHTHVSHDVTAVTGNHVVAYHPLHGSVVSGTHQSR